MIPYIPCAWCLIVGVFVFLSNHGQLASVLDPAAAFAPVGAIGANHAPESTTCCIRMPHVLYTGHE